MKLRVYRYDPEGGQSPRMQDYELDIARLGPNGIKGKMVLTK